MKVAVMPVEASLPDLRFRSMHTRADNHAWTRVNEGCLGPPTCNDRDRGDQVLSWAALVLVLSL